MSEDKAEAEKKVVDSLSDAFAAAQNGNIDEALMWASVAQDAWQDIDESEEIA